MSITSEFDPAQDGWYFENWEEDRHFIDSSDFSWDLFRQSYLGINPAHDCIKAPLDCAFYELFKNCAGQGNCGGMSLLGLALFKYGGYQGFCVPACFYSGVDWPDREDLHRAINIFQARQFSAPGIENFLDVVNEGDLDNGVAAFNKISSHLGSGDYALLSIANDMLGDHAHTVIPYEVDDSPSGEPPGTRYIYVYDPNYSYDDHAAYYISRSNRVVIRSAFNWEYHQGFYDGLEHNGTHYSGGWCFAIPMSIVLRKARHPLAVDMVLDALTTLLVSGTGAAVTQIEDESGRRFYKTGTEVPGLRSDIEKNPAYRLPDAGRWPWYADDKTGELPGDLYFLRRPKGSRALKVTVSGRNYKMTLIQGKNIIEVQARGREQASDVIHLSGMATNQQVLMLKTGGKARRYDIRQQRLLTEGAGWRSIGLQNAGISEDGLQIRTIGDLQDFEISGLERKVYFNVDLKQYTGKFLTKRAAGRHSAAAGRTVRFSPQDWNDLEKTKVEKKFYQWKKR